MSYKKDRKKVFNFNQYWNIHYTEVFKDCTEKDYKVIIQARSFNFAKEILAKKVLSDNPGHKIKAIQGYMLTKASTINGLRLNLKDWECINHCVFPNSTNILFKFHKERPEHYTNRFNDQFLPKMSGFTKGHTRNYHYIPPEHEKPYWLFNGKWRPWPKKDRENLKEKVILALSLNKNSRRKAAQELGYSERNFYKLINEKFIEVDWAKDYPPEKPKPRLNTAILAKRNQSLKNFYAKKRKAKAKIFAPQIHKLLAQGYSKNKITQILKIGKPFIKYCIENGK